MNIAYLLYREDIFSPLVESQVLNNLYKIAKYGHSIHFIWLKRLDYCFKYSEKINTVRKAMKSNGIVLHEIPIIVGRFPIGSVMTKLVYLQSANSIRKLLKENSIDILHTRGYNAGLMAMNLLKNSNIKHLFDPRSPYLTEIVSTYNLHETDKKFEFWKENEKNIVKNATAVVAISQTFSEYLKSLGGNVIFIPNNSEMELPEVVEKRVEKQRRKSICFVGSLGYGWNNVIEYISFMKRVWDIDPTILLELYVLKQDVVREELKKAGVSSNQYSIKTLPQSEVCKTISGCIAGLQIMSRPDSRLGIKTVDYLSAGVPVICNSNAMGASQVVNQYRVGWNIDEVALSEIIQLAELDKQMTYKAIQVAYSNFSTEAVSKKYHELYLEMMK